MQTADGRTGKAWRGTVFGGRRKDSECVRRLVPDKTGLILIGAGTRIAASTSGGRPQVFDLATGRTVWAGEKSGVPIDGDGKSVLVREYADEGALTVLDFETGTVRWTAEDPWPVRPVRQLGLRGHRRPGRGEWCDRRPPVRAGLRRRDR